MIQKYLFLKKWIKQECLSLATEVSSRTRHFIDREPLMVAAVEVPSLARIATITQLLTRVPNLKTQFHNNRLVSVLHKLPQTDSVFRKLMSLKQHQRCFNQYHSPLLQFYLCLRILTDTMPAITLPSRRSTTTLLHLLVYTRKLIVIAAGKTLKLKQMPMPSLILRPVTIFTMGVLYQEVAYEPCHVSAQVRRFTTSVILTVRRAALSSIDMSPRKTSAIVKK